MVQVCFVYFFTSLAKLQGELWLNGTAVYYTMRVKEFMATSWNIPLTENHYFVIASTYFTLLWEMAFSFLIWFRQTKYWIIALGTVLHVGIWVFMRIDNFSWIMIGSYFVFISNKEYIMVFGRYQPGKLTVFIDTWCPNCVRVGKLIQKLDFFGSIKVADARQIKNSVYHEILDENTSLNRIATLINGKVYYGFSSFIQLCLSLPMLWLLLPPFYLLKALKLGDWIYDEVAIRRKLIPLHCSEELCTIKHD